MCPSTPSSPSPHSRHLGSLSESAFSYLFSFLRGPIFEPYFSLLTTGDGGDYLPGSSMVWISNGRGCGQAPCLPYRGCSRVILACRPSLSALSGCFLIYPLGLGLDDSSYRKPPLISRGSSRCLPSPLCLHSESPCSFINISIFSPWVV